MNDKVEPVPKSEFELKREHRERMERIEISDMTQKVHKDVFSEEWDFIYDSHSDVRDRRKGINPMNAEYATRVNQKRSEWGLEPLGDNGLPTDSNSWDIAKELATAMVQSKRAHT